jgi:hypothetical protein
MAEQTAGRNGVADIADRETNDFGRETSHRTQRQSAAATSLRDSHPARASHSSHLRRHYQPPFPLRCKRQTGQHILMTELGEVFQKFRLTGASGQALQDVPHGQSCSPHTGLAEPNSRIDGDVLKPRGAFTGCSMPMARPIAVAVPGRPRGPERCHD